MSPTKPSISPVFRFLAGVLSIGSFSVAIFLAYHGIFESPAEAVPQRIDPDWLSTMLYKLGSAFLVAYLSLRGAFPITRSSNRTGLFFRVLGVLFSIRYFVVALLLAYDGFFDPPVETSASQFERDWVSWMLFELGGGVLFGHVALQGSDPFSDEPKPAGSEA